MNNKLNNLINKIVIIGILISVLMVLIFIINKTIFTIILGSGIIIFLISKIRGNNMLSFLKHFGKSKAKSAGSETRKMIARLDKEGFSDAVLGEMQETLEKFGLELAQARKRAKKEKDEYIEVKKLYDQRLTAAESIKASVDAGDTSKESSLLKLVELLESTAQSVQNEKSEAEFWTEHLATIQNRYDSAAADLRGARQKISQGSAKLEQAEIKQEQTRLKSEEQKRASGLTSSMSSLDAALGALDDATEKAEAKAEAAEISLETFKSSNIEKEDDVIKEAMEAVSGKGASASISDRLANLK